MYDIIIVGAGPAGLTAALYALRANKKVLVLEASSYGGQIINANKVENYPAIDSISGFDFATNLYNQVKKLGAEIKFETVIKVNKEREVFTSNNSYKSKAVILATGAKNRKLSIQNEDKFIGKGISYCATCDGSFYKNKIVAVNGGGNAAIEDAIYLSNIANKVYLIHRREEYRAEERNVRDLKNKDNVEFVLNANISKLIGDKNLEKIEVTFTEGSKKEIDINGLFIAIGQEPKNQIFSNIAKINDKGYFTSEDGVHTKTPHIYIAGDGREKYLRQLTTAVSDGAIAATIAIKEMMEVK